MESRSRGTQLSIVFLALGAALLLAPFADAFYPRFRNGRDIEHHRGPNFHPGNPENLGDLQRAYDGKYPSIGKSPHYNPLSQPPYYEHQPPFNVQPNFEAPRYNGPPVTFDGPPPSYNVQPPPPPPPSFDAPPPSYEVQPPLPPSYDVPLSAPPPYNAPPSQSLSYNAPPPPPPYNELLPPPPPPFNVPPLPYNALPPPQSGYVPPGFNSPHAPFHPLKYRFPRPFDLRPGHHQRAPPPPPSFQGPPANDDSQTPPAQGSPEQENSSPPPASSDSKDDATKSESSDSSSSTSTESTPQKREDTSSTDSAADTSSLSSADSSAPPSPFPNEITHALPVILPPYQTYTMQSPATYLATMSYNEEPPPWVNYRPVHRVLDSKYRRPPGHQRFANRIPRRFENDPYYVVDYTDEGVDEGAGVEGFDFGEPEEDEDEVVYDEFGYQPRDIRMPRFEHRQQFSEEERPRPYKPYRPYKRHDNYIKNHYNSENMHQQSYAQYPNGAIQQQPPATSTGMEISDALLESMVKQAIVAVRREEEESRAWPEQRYQYYDSSPYAEERPAFVTAQQPKGYRLEPYRSDDDSPEIEWTPEDDATPERQLELVDEGIVVGEQPQKVDLLDDLQQPPPTVTEPTIVDLLPETTTASR